MASVNSLVISKIKRLKFNRLDTNINQTITNTQAVAKNGRQRSGQGSAENLQGEGSAGHEQLAVHGRFVFSYQERFPHLCFEFRLTPAQDLEIPIGQITLSESSQAGIASLDV